MVPAQKGGGYKADLGQDGWEGEHGPFILEDSLIGPAADGGMDPVVGFGQKLHLGGDFNRQFKAWLDREETRSRSSRGFAPPHPFPPESTFKMEAPMPRVPLNIENA
jgi:hypothetical protein